MERKRTIFVPYSGADFEIKKKDEFDGSFGASLERA
jgi:hypothetical protein